MPIVKTSAKGQIVIPKKIREKLKIIPETSVLLRVLENHAEITPLPDNQIKACGEYLRAANHWQVSSWSKKLAINSIKDFKVNICDTTTVRTIFYCKFSNPFIFFKKATCPFSTIEYLSIFSLEDFTFSHFENKRIAKQSGVPV